MSIEPKIRIRGLHKAFGAKKVLQGLDLDVMPGESFVVIGGSGSGKSVLLKCILGLITPDSGSIHIDGVDVTKLSNSDREKQMLKFGMLFQGGALFDSLKVWQNVSFRAIHSGGMSKKQARDLAVKTLKQVGLSADVANLSPSELSGGMQKRVGLARAIATRPEIIFFDEPTTGLDPIMADVINDLIVACVKDLGATGLSITHDMHSVRKIANRVGMLYQGKLHWQGTVDDLDKTDDAYIKQFVNGMSTGPIQLAV